jgi:hypothetical protein
MEFHKFHVMITSKVETCREFQGKVVVLTELFLIYKGVTERHLWKRWHNKNTVSAIHFIFIVNHSVTKIYIYSLFTTLCAHTHARTCTLNLTVENHILKKYP